LAPAAAELSSVSHGGSATRTALYVVVLLATVAVGVIATRGPSRAARQARSRGLMTSIG
jgi:hypothetical protein